MNRDKKRDDPNKSSEHLLQGISKYRENISNIVFIFGGMIIAYLTIYFGSVIEKELLGQILFFSAVISIFICLFSFVIIRIVLKYDEPYQDQETKKSIDGKLKCRDCMHELLDIQKHLYVKDVEAALQELSVEDIQKINTLTRALSVDDDSITEDEIKKIQKFCNILLKAKSSDQYASYITIDDMKVIESRVDEGTTIIIVSSSVSCDDELLPIIVSNLINGVQYKYYFPTSKKRDGSGTKGESFKALLRQFNSNLSVWQEDARISYETIKNQVKCAWFPEEFMQMSFTAYNYDRVGAEGKSPEIIVKFPALDTTVSNEYPLFYYVNKENGINKKMIESIDFISDNATELKIVKSETGNAQFADQN